MFLTFLLHHKYKENYRTKHYDEKHCFPISLIVSMSKLHKHREKLNFMLPKNIRLSLAKFYSKTRLWIWFLIFFFFFEYRGRTESLFLSLFIFYYDLWLPLLLLTYLLNSLSQILPKWIIARICEFYHRSNSENWSLFSERNRCKQILRQPQNFLVLSKKYIWWDQQGLLAGLPFLLSPPSPWGDCLGF